MVEVDRGLPLEKIEEFSLEELLGMAIKAEIGAAKFYESLAENIDIEVLKEKIRFLAKEEKKHEAFLRKMYRETFPDKEIIFPKEHIGPELQPVARKLEEIEDVIDLYRWAMEAEKIANEFYLKLEDRVDDEKTKRILRSLANMESAHYFTLKADYELLLDWEMYSQMMHIGP
ncbi:hypothetical protein PAP_03360 [Palaeococcus pacificus DY20341]|uniref:Rubrerythrin diiron-binding domain-containing protein n=1 Tax=Palaeococcus pacificus DY20341 TaxID=1343739 RepID=A0A075LT30_9EURY|nr:ferritin family protein [Palaeococcus pacificus]AIF69092.1 hypothetical protein PAP_03360 [Palaeococcus pacificus DY20341]